MTHFLQLFPVLGLLWPGNCQPGKYHGLSRLVPAFKPDPFWLSSLAYETEPQDPVPNARVQLPIHQQDLSAESASRDAQVQIKVTRCLYKHLLGACPVCVRQSSPGWEFKKTQALPLGRSQAPTRPCEVWPVRLPLELALLPSCPSITAIQPLGSPCHSWRQQTCFHRQPLPLRCSFLCLRVAVLLNQFCVQHHVLGEAFSNHPSPK